jgi:hypothetical protein
MGLTSGAGLTCSVWVERREVCTSLKANMTQDIQELTKPCIKRVLAHHSG